MQAFFTNSYENFTVKSKKNIILAIYNYSTLFLL